MREVRIHPDTGTAEVIVPDFQLSLAIGKEGQNARLAARLTGWRVDIKSETQLAEEESGGGVEYAEGEWVTNDSGELVWQPAEGGETISAAEAGLRGARTGGDADVRRRRRRPRRGDGRRGRRCAADAGGRRRNAAEAAHGRSQRRWRGPQSTEEADGERRVTGPVRTCIGCRRVGGRRGAGAASARAADRRWSWEPGPGRGAWLCRDHPVECLDRGVSADGRSTGHCAPGSG